MKRSIIKIVFYSFCFHTIVGCNSESNSKDSQFKIKAIDKRESYIRAINGSDEEIDSNMIERGKVMISYSDCYTCHKEDKKLIGPSFSDIDLRYPRKEVFIKILAQRIIHGGRGSWGNAEMSAHPKLKTEDAEDMVAYILSFSSSASK